MSTAKSHKATTVVSEESLLSLSMRPRRLSELVGQAALVEAMRQQMAKRPPAAFLFSGPSRCGKTTLARILAVAFQCIHQTQWGEPCDACLKQQDQYDIHEINASEVTGVDDLRGVVQMGRCAPSPPSIKRIIILDEAQMMSSNAQNLLLKPFEDSAERTVWIICTTDPRKILVTLRNRCMVYQVKPVGFEAREVLLKRAAKVIGLNRPLAPLLEATSAAQMGAPGLLLMALEKYAAGLDTDTAVAGTDVVNIDTLALCRAVAGGNWTAARRILSEAVPEEARWIRASVAGYIRSMLLRQAVPGEHLTWALTSLTSGNAPLDDSSLLNWLIGMLAVICRKLRAE